MSAKCYRWVGVVTGVILFFVAALSVNAQASVTVVTASASPTSSSGPCPVTFAFSSIITSDSAGTVAYRWEWSNGGIGPTTTITFSGAGSQTVTTTWTLGPSGTNTYWEQVHVLSPNDTTSNQASFTLSCGGGGGAFSLDLHAGWNMISSPVGTVELSPIQGDCSFSSGPWWWNGTSYQIATMIEPAKGYWVLISNPCTMQAFGNHTSEGLTLVSGWNMISSSGSWIMMNTGGCSLISGLWWYDGSSYQTGIARCAHGRLQGLLGQSER
jgi:hypothetical protein